MYVYIYFCLAISLEQAVAPANPFIHRKKAHKFKGYHFLKTMIFYPLHQVEIY